MKRPAVGLVLLFAAGIALSTLVPLGTAVWLLVAAGLLAAFGWWRHSPAARWLLGAAVFTAGGLLLRHATTTPAQDDIAQLLGADYQPAIVRGLVVSDAAGRPSFQLAVEALHRDNEWQSASGELFVFVRERDDEDGGAENVATDDRATVRYGDRVECSLVVQPPHPSRNPHVFDFAAWLGRQNIHLTGSIGGSDYCQVQARDAGNPIQALALRWRDRLEQALLAGLEDEPKLASVLAGIVIGERAEIPPATYTSFQQTGTFHVFSVSGLHVTLMTVILVIALRLAHLPRRWCGLIAMPILVLYVFATGARPGALRALAMAGVFLGGWILVRPTDLINTLAVAALVILVVAPTQLFDGGFILSFGSVFALVALTPSIEERLRHVVAPDPFLPDKLVPKWRKKIDGGVVWLVRAVAASWAAWLGLLPLLAWYFNLFTPVSILANVVAVPLVGANLALGLVSIMVHPLWPGLAIIFNNANFFMLHVMLGAVESLGRLPYGHWYVQCPPPWIAAVYYAALVLWFLPGPPRRYRVAGVIAGGLVVAAGLWLTARQQAPVEITVLDLPRGAATFVNVPGETADTLVDTGDEFGGAQIVLPFLRGEGVDRLGTVWFTRGTKAHVAGAGALLEAAPVGSVVHSGLGARSRYYHQLLEAIEQQAVPLRSVKAGADTNWGDSVRVRVLHPAADWKAARSEDNSLVFLLEHADIRILFLGDAGETVEQELIRAHPDLRAHVIVKGRHGSEPSGTRAFLAIVRPQVVVLAASPQFGHRSQPDLRERLEPLGIQLYRTDESGAVRIELRPSGHSITPWL